MDTLAYDHMFELMLRMSPDTLYKFSEVNSISNEVYYDINFWRQYVGANVYEYRIFNSNEKEVDVDALFREIEEGFSYNYTEEEIYDQPPSVFSGDFDEEVYYSYPIHLFHMILEPAGDVVYVILVMEKKYPLRITEIVGLDSSDEGEVIFRPLTENVNDWVRGRLNMLAYGYLKFED